MFFSLLELFSAVAVGNRRGGGCRGTTALSSSWLFSARTGACGIRIGAPVIAVLEEAEAVREWVGLCGARGLEFDDGGRATWSAGRIGIAGGAMEDDAV